VAAGKLILTVSVPEQQIELIFTSDDGGDSWRRLASVGVATDDQTDAGISVAVSSDGTVLIAASGNMERIDSASGSLNEQALTGIPSGALITSLSFADANHGWAVVFTGACRSPKQQCETSNRLYTTEDGGFSWHELAP